MTKILLFSSERGVQGKFISLILILEANMKAKIFCPKRTSAGMIVLAALLCAAVLPLLSCDLPEGPGFGKGTLTLLLPETAAHDTAAGASRSVISYKDRDRLIYKLSLTGPGEPQPLEIRGGGKTIYLEAGEWIIVATAWLPPEMMDNPDDPPVQAGAGETVITVIAGRNISVRIPMWLDSAYEALLEEFYIHNEVDLRRIGAEENGLPMDEGYVFYLENDIVLTSWTPIGFSDGPFRAVFDGQGHSITIKSFSGPKVDGSNAYLGLFGCTSEGAVIKNTIIKYTLDTPVSFGDDTYNAYAGGVAGYAFGTPFENIKVEGNFPVQHNGYSGTLVAGGIAGYVRDGRIEGCHVSDASISGSSSSSDIQVGGIAAFAYDGTIEGCHVSDTDVKGDSESMISIGGVAGKLSNSSPAPGSQDISESSFTNGTVIGRAGGSCEAGGIVGTITDVEIIDSFAEGRVEAQAGNEASVGGIAGYDGGSTGVSLIQTCYAAGVIKSESVGTRSRAGGIAGRSAGTIEDCYAWVEVRSKINNPAIDNSAGEEEGGGIAGENDHEITRCYARGTVKSLTLSTDKINYMALGGIVGDGWTVSDCMALVSELDGGTSIAVIAKDGHAIGSGNSFSGNYALEIVSAPVRDKMYVHNITSISDQGPDTPQNGAIQPLADFQNAVFLSTTPKPGWNFAAETGDWKFLSTGSGYADNPYPYPVLSWQDKPPTDPARFLEARE
jgi:hypothetical protein